MEKTVFEMTQDSVMGLGQARFTKDQIGEEAAIVVAVRPDRRGGESDKDETGHESTLAVLGKGGNLITALVSAGMADRDMKSYILRAAMILTMHD